MTARKPLLVQKDRRGIERIPARDFITPVLQWSGAPSKAEVVDISVGGAALKYEDMDTTISDIFEISLEAEDGFTVENLSFEKLSHQTIETQAGTFETTLRGRFLDLTDVKFNRLKRIVYYTFQHYRSLTGEPAPFEGHLEKETASTANAHQTPDVPQGVLPICSSCKRIRDPQGTWHTVEIYMRSALGVNLSHSICPRCAPQMYPWLKE